MRVYLDNSATTVCCPQAAEAVMQAMTENYGNPSSMHVAGVEAEKAVKQAAAQIAATLKVNEKEILFTSGGTESDNLAIFGAAAAYGRLGRHMITTAVEHPAVAEPMTRLRKEGWDITVLPVDERGLMDPEDLAKALRPDTRLVSVMAVNNEVGTVMPLEETGRLVHEKSEALLHVDAVQGYGKFRFLPKRTGIDLLSVSSHKIHGPKGAGFLYVAPHVRLVPQILGGGQQGGLRSGTDNVPGISGMGAAAAAAYANLEQEQEYLRSLKQRLAEGFEELDDVVINGMSSAEGAPHILNASFLGIRSEVLLHALGDKGICVSAGSACSTHKRKPSGTLAAMNLESARRESALRFSFSRYNTPEEVEYTLETLRQLVPMLRRYTRK